MCDSTRGWGGQTAASRSLMAPLRTHSDHQSAIPNSGPLGALCEWLFRREGSKSHSWGREQEGTEETHHCSLSVLTVKPQLSGEKDMKSLYRCGRTGGWTYRCVQRRTHTMKNSVSDNNQCLSPVSEHSRKQKRSSHMDTGLKTIPL